MGWNESPWEAIKFLWSGETMYREFSHESFSYKVDRLTVKVSWKNYRKFRGVLRRAATRQGVISVEVSFNPGLDEALFDSMRTLGETVFFVTADTSAEDLHESLGGGVPFQRDVPHILELLVRGSRDVGALHAYFLRLMDISARTPHRLNGPITLRERNAMGYWAATLTQAGQTGNFIHRLTPFNIADAIDQQEYCIYGS